LLGIQESISRTEERECFFGNRDRESFAGLRLRIPLMTNASRFGGMHCVCQRTGRSPSCGTYWFVLGWQAEKAFSRSRCQDASAVFPV